MVFRGAFFVILVYVLVYIYNTGLLTRLKRQPTPAQLPIPSPIVEIELDEDPSLESSPSEELLKEL
jgi:hypothetical protein